MLFGNISLCAYFSLDEKLSVVIEFSVWNNERNINVPYLIYVNWLKPIDYCIEWSYIRNAEYSLLVIARSHFGPM